MCGYILRVVLKTRYIRYVVFAGIIVDYSNMNLREISIDVSHDFTKIVW